MNCLTNGNIKAVALCYLKGGFSVIPVKPNSKEPAIRWKDKTLMNDGLVEKFFFSDSNIAVVTGKISNLTVIDVDDAERFNNFYSLEILKQKAKTVISTPKGMHFWFLYDPELKTAQNQIFGFDVRNDSGLAVCPPSRVNEKEYKFLKAEGLSPIPEDFKEKLFQVNRIKIEKTNKFDLTLSRLKVARKLSDGKFRCYCPSHDDRDPSLDIWEDKERVRLHCWAGCSENDILKAIGLEIKTEEKGSITKSLLKLVEKFEVFINQNSEEFIELNNSKIIRIDSKEFRKILQFLAFQEFGKPAHTQAVLEVISTIAGKALTEGKRTQTYIRVGAIDEGIEIDLCNDNRAIRITKERIEVSKASAKFERPFNLQPLPIPDLNIYGDEWSLLKKFLNLDNEKLILALAWLFGSLNVTGEYPILNIVGEREGVGKTTATRFIKSIIDPSSVNTKPLPKTEDDLLVVCLQNHIVAFDNISTISETISDALCRISTGSGLAKRKLFTDSEAVLYFVKKPIILNGIDLFPERRDLRRRCIHVELQKILEPKPTPFLEMEFKRLHPKLLGWLCHAVQKALCEEITEPLDLTDMASFVQFVCKARRIFPVGGLDFISLFKQNRERASFAILSENPTVQFLTEITDYSDWKGTASELWDLLNQRYLNTSLKNLIPKDAKALGKKLKRMLSDLENLGISCEITRDSKATYYQIKKFEKSLNMQPLLTQPLINKGLDDGQRMVRDAQSESLNTVLPQQKPLKNNDSGQSGQMLREKPDFLTNDFPDPDDIQILED